jgi:hypothetical protein
MIGLVVAPGAFAEDDPVYNPELAALNDQLALMGVTFELETAEYFTTEEGPDFGNTVLAKDVGNKQLPHHFVPFDARRPWSGPGSAITWVTDLADGSTASGLSAADTAGAIRSAMQTWEDVQCSELSLRHLGNASFDLGLVQFLLGYGGTPLIYADITHAGWLPAAFFDNVAPNGSATILGVTFTFTFRGGDSNGDGRGDTAFREIYYNDGYSWAIGAHTDVETVVLHEAGHSLSQQHFGAISIKNDGSLQTSPDAVMNAAYSRVQHELTGSDNGGHCSIWSSWPNN